MRMNLLIALQFAILTLAFRRIPEAETMYNGLIKSHFAPSLTLEFDKHSGYHLKTTKEISASQSIYNHTLESICTVFEDFPFKEILTKQFLNIIAASTVQLPLQAEMSYELSTYVQAFRYLIALYGDKSVLVDSSCPDSFLQYLKVAMATASNILAWPAEDVKFLQELSLRPLSFSEPETIFTKLEEQVQLRGLGPVFKHIEEFKKLHGLLLYKGTRMAYRKWLNVMPTKYQETHAEDEFNDNYFSQAAILIPGLELVVHIQPRSLSEARKIVFTTVTGTEAGLTHYAAKNFKENEVYGYNFLSKHSNLDLLTMQGVIVEDNVLDVTQLMVPNSISFLDGELKPIAQIVKFWEEKYTKGDPFQEKTLQFDIVKAKLNNRLLNYLRLMNLQGSRLAKSKDMLSSYRNTSTFFPENEIRALAMYSTVFKARIKNSSNSMKKFRDMLTELENKKIELNETKEADAITLESIERKENIVKTFQGTLHVYRQHIDLATMKLGIYEYVKLEKTLENILQ